MESNEPLRVVSPGTPGLRRIYRLLAETPEIRSELVEDVRVRMSDGRYMDADKLNMAIYRMLKDALR